MASAWGREKKCREHVRFLVQSNIHTAACGNTFGGKLGKEYKNKTYGSVVGVESTVLDENNTHLCAILFLADALNACLSLGRDKGIKKAREFIAMISCSVYDSTVTDKEFMDILGEDTTSGDNKAIVHILLICKLH